jgi:hypothetical protein
MNNKKHKQMKIGNIYAIPLPNGKYAFGRTYKDACIAIYNHIGDTVDDLPKTEEYQFIVGVYKDILKSGQWPVVSNRPFNSDEEQWPPPMYVIDSISGEYSIYHKGELRTSSKGECEGLEEAAVWEAEHIIDRIMGEDKWHRR